MTRSLRSRIEALEERYQPPREPVRVERHIVDRVRMADGLDHSVVKTILTRGPDFQLIERNLPESEWIDHGPCAVTLQT